MNDDVKAAVELWRETTDKTCSCIDCVAVRTTLAHLDAEPARIAAAVAEERRAVTLVTRGAVYWDGDRCLSSVAGSIAAAREEQRALDLEAAEWGAEWCSCQSEIAKASLNATPLADRIAELEADRARLEEAEEGTLKLVAEEHHGRITAEAEAERLRRLLDEHMESDCRAAAERDEALEAGRVVVRATDEMRGQWAETEERLTAERDEAVKALRGLRREVSARLTGRDSEPGEFEKAWQTACAVLAKYPEET